MDSALRDCLEEIIRQAHAIQQYTSRLTLDAYRQDDKTQAAVERRFEIIGEALNRIAKIDSTVVKRIRDYKNIIAFRNILAHGYDHVDPVLVWGVIEGDVLQLLDDVAALLENEGD